MQGKHAITCQKVFTAGPQQGELCDKQARYCFVDAEKHLSIVLCKTHRSHPFYKDGPLFKLTPFEESCLSAPKPRTAFQIFAAIESPDLEQRKHMKHLSDSHAEAILEEKWSQLLDRELIIYKTLEREEADHYAKKRAAQQGVERSTATQQDM
jgi:hypothetical protein